MKSNYHQIEQSAGDTAKSKHSPSPIFNKIAEYYGFPYSYEDWSSSGRGAVEFKKRVKSYMISMINESVEKYANGLPFLTFNLPEDAEKERFYELRFDKGLQNFLNERNVRQVFAYKGDTSYIIPLSIEQFANRTKEKLILKGGFEINLAYASMQHMLYDFAHEIAHTFFYDISSDAPSCLISNQTLSIKKWYQEFEGLAFDFGREIWLPRRAFTNYVKSRYEKPSIENFLKMYAELQIGVDPLAQRLLHDLKLWKALMFWGTVYKGERSSDKNNGYYVRVGSRGRRRNGLDRIYLDDELKSRESELSKTIIEHVDSGNKLGKYSITLDRKTYCFDISTKESLFGENNFIAILYQN